MGKHAKPEEIVAKLRQLEVLTAQGKSIDVHRRGGDPSYRRGRAPIP